MPEKQFPAVEHSYPSKALLLDGDNHDKEWFKRNSQTKEVDFKTKSSELNLQAATDYVNGLFSRMMVGNTTMEDGYASMAHHEDDDAPSDGIEDKAHSNEAMD